MRGRKTLLILLLLAWAVPAAAQEKPSCVTHCHGTEGKAFEQCVHEGQLSCVDCHGGNPAAQRDEKASHDPAKGYIGKPPRERIPELCGSCHSDALRMHPYALKTDQLAHYRYSQHGKALAGGDTAVAVCTDCHNSHGILPADDPRAPTSRHNQPKTCGKCHTDELLMKRHGLPWDSVARFRDSVHGRSLKEGTRGAPSCSDCHGSHGATPPGVDQIVHVCGECHANTAEHFLRGPHKDAKEMECAACHPEQKGPEYRRAGCASCHGAHAIHQPGDWLYEGDEVGRCGHCHRTDDAATKLAAVIRDGRKQLRESMAKTRGDLRRAKQRGLFLEHEKTYLLDSERTLVFLQPLAHTMDEATLKKHLDDGLKRQERVRERIAKRTTVLRDRRILLFGFAFLVALLAFLLRAKLMAIRRLS